MFVYEAPRAQQDQRRVAVDLGRLQRGRLQRGRGADVAQPGGQQAGHLSGPHDGHPHGLHDSPAVAQENDVRREDVEQALHIARFGRALERLERVPGLGRGNDPARPARRDVGPRPVRDLYEPGMLASMMS